MYPIICYASCCFLAPQIIHPSCKLENKYWTVVCIFLSSMAPPLASVAKVGANKTHSVIREIISQSSSDLRAKPRGQRGIKCSASQVLSHKEKKKKTFQWSNDILKSLSVQRCWWVCVDVHGCARVSWTECSVCPEGLWWKSNTSCFLWQEEVLPLMSPYRYGHTGWVEGGRQRRGRGGGGRGAEREVKEARQREGTEEVWGSFSLLLFGNKEIKKTSIEVGAAFCSLHLLVSLFLQKNAFQKSCITSNFFIITLHQNFSLEC